MNLRERSIDVVLDNQTSNGAFIASPNFPTYRYSWFRDGAFIAYSMDVVGEHDSSGRFHEWVATRICAMETTVESVIEAVRTGRPLGPDEFLHTRYAPSGEPADEDWPNHQLDGFGTWLWAFEQHLAMSERAPTPSQSQAMKLIVEYLEALWDQPCYDCWEEHGDKVHTYTLSAVQAGLRAFGRLTNSTSSVVDAIAEHIEGSLIEDGRYVKFAGAGMVDASLVGLAVPYASVEPSSPVVRRTIEEIEAELRATGGVHRFRTDTYYGGGEWVLLTCWLAWYYYSVGQTKLGDECMAWVEAQATDTGDLPEQVVANPLDPEFVQPWRDRWGPEANPLVWSHAMYLIADSMR